jgi:hypothetical protein
VWSVHSKALGTVSCLLRECSIGGGRSLQGSKVHRYGDSFEHLVWGPKEIGLPVSPGCGLSPASLMIQNLVVRWERPQWWSDDNIYFRVIFKTHNMSGLTPFILCPLCCWWFHPMNISCAHIVHLSV